MDQDQTAEITIASDVVTLEQALASIAAYPRSTLLYFDRGSDEDRTTIEDIGQLTLIGSALRGGDAAALLSADMTQVLAPIPRGAHLIDADPGLRGGLYDLAEKAYAEVTEPSGISHAKASKLLHLKRPHLFPILDSQVRLRYDDAATNAAALYPERGYTRMYWAAIRHDLIGGRGFLTVLRHELLKGADAGDQHQGRAAAVSDVRLLDLITWRPDRNTP